MHKLKKKKILGGVGVCTPLSIQKIGWRAQIANKMYKLKKKKFRVASLQKFRASWYAVA
jgi:hypothetical protein